MTPDLTKLLIRLGRLRRVPLEVLTGLVLRDGACMWPVPAGEPSLLTERLTDRELAERLCGGCNVRDACLEWELRASGADTVGVWGGLTDDDRRALYPLWEWRRSS